MRHFINWGCLAVPPLHPPDKKFVAKAVSAKQRSMFIGKPPPRICRYSRVNCLGLPPPPPCVQNFSNSLLIFLHSCSNQFIIQPTQSTSRRTCHVMVVHESVPSWPLLGVFFESVHQNFARLSSFIFCEHLPNLQRSFVQRSLCYLQKLEPHAWTKLKRQTLI